MNAVEQSIALIQEYRDRCLWFMKPDYMPQTTIEIVRVLDLIERYGDRSGYCRAREIKQWLRGEDRTVMQWARDSAYRFFPLIEDDLMGMTLHPFDLATNKILAMAGRLEVRDWVDVLNCDDKLQLLGYLIWAACGKDPGYNPQSLLAAARRLHYSQAEVDTLDFDGTQPDAAVLGRHWHAALDTAANLCELLPFDYVGYCVITKNGELYRGDAQELGEAIDANKIAFHPGRIGGAWPKIIEE